MPDLSIPKVFKGVRPGADEKSSAWVVFPHRQCMYMLPVVKRQRTIKPVFNPDGTIGIQTVDVDETPGEMFDLFMYTAAQAHVTGGIDTTANSFSLFVGLVRYMLQKNYDMDDAAVADLLAIKESELSRFFCVIVNHCNGE